MSKSENGGIDPALPLPVVMAAVGLSRQTIWRMVREGRFPKPIHLTERKIAWRAAVIKRWLKARDKGPPAP